MIAEVGLTGPQDICRRFFFQLHTPTAVLQLRLSRLGKLPFWPFRPENFQGVRPGFRLVRSPPSCQSGRFVSRLLSYPGLPPDPPVLETCWSGFRMSLLLPGKSATGMLGNLKIESHFLGICKLKIKPGDRLFPGSGLLRIQIVGRDRSSKGMSSFIEIGIRL
jgi:hypothetical protein